MTCGTSGTGTRWAAWDGHFTPGRFCLLLALMVAGFYPDVVLGGYSFYYRDFSLFGYPLAQYHKERFWAGELPLWNPYNNCGIPFMAQWNTLVFYPGALIYLVLPLPWSLNVYCLAHVVLAGMSMYALVWAWTGVRLSACVAGVAFALNGVTLHALMWPNNLAALAWMPLVILAVERGVREGGRWLYGAALLGGLQLLSGAPELLVFTWAIAGSGVLVQTVLEVWRQTGARGAVVPVMRLGVVGGLASAVAAVQLLPFLDLLAQSQRNAGFGNDAWAMPIWGWANLLVPLFHMTPSVTGVFSQDAQQWTSSYYVGIGVVALAVVGWVNRRSGDGWKLGWLSVCAVAGLVLALGDQGGVLPLLKRIFPAAGIARFPVKYVVISIWAIPVLAGFGIRSLVGAGDVVEGVARRRWSVVGIVVGGMALLLGTLAWCFPVEGEAGLRTLWSGVSRVGYLVGIGMAVWWLMGEMKCSAGWARGVVVLVLVGLDAVTHVPRQNPTVQAQAMEPGVVTERSWPAWQEGRAMLHPATRTFFGQAAHPDAREHALGYRRALYPNWNLFEHVAMPDGFFSLYFKHQQEVWSSIYGEGGQWSEPLADFLGVRIVSSATNLFEWESRVNAKPLVTGGQQPVLVREGEALRRIRRGDFRPEAEVLVEAAAQSRWGQAKPGRVEVLGVTWEAQRMGLDVQAEAEAALVVAQTYAPGWRATVNGREVRVERVNHAFVGMLIPPGRSRVELRYRDPLLGVGGIVSAVGLAGCLAALGCRRGRAQAGAASR